MNLYSIEVTYSSAGYCYELDTTSTIEMFGRDVEDAVSRTRELMETLIEDCGHLSGLKSIEVEGEHGW